MSTEFSFIKCKNCRAELDIRKAVGGVVECEYCHTPWTVPKEETSPEALKYLHDGNAALDVCKFEDAYTYFQKAAEFDANEPEAYFGMALASFKVQYLKDEVNDCLQPICHEISEKAFTDDKNYKKALELASIEQKRVYRRKGGEIDEIRDEFFALERSGLRYDSFICVKVTEEDGRTHTEDYNRANDIYYYLKDNGYKPFYSEREMKGRTGSAYEALILYALYTSECMLIVCSDEGYLQTKWVKNEYTRFISLMQEGGKERDALTFVFTGKPIEKLPTGKKIQGIDILKPDAYSRITEYVESHTPEARRKREEEELKQKNPYISENQILDIIHKAQNEEKKKEFLENEKKRKLRENYEKYLVNFNIDSQGILHKYLGKDREVFIPEGVKEIATNAFFGCSTIETVRIPITCTKIGKCAFAFCGGLKRVEIPNSINFIDRNAFRGSERFLVCYCEAKLGRQMWNAGYLKRRIAIVWDYRRWEDEEKEYVIRKEVGKENRIKDLKSKIDFLSPLVEKENNALEKIRLICRILFPILIVSIMAVFVYSSESSISWVIWLAVAYSSIIVLFIAYSIFIRLYEKRKNFNLIKLRQIEFALEEAYKM